MRPHLKCLDTPGVFIYWSVNYRYVQLPVNAAMPEAWKEAWQQMPNQAQPGEDRQDETTSHTPAMDTLINVAARLGVGVFSSGPLQEGELLGNRHLQVQSVLSKDTRHTKTSRYPSVCGLLKYRCSIDEKTMRRFSRQNCPASAGRPILGLQISQALVSCKHAFASRHQCPVNLPVYTALA